MGAHRHKTSPGDMAEKKRSLLALIEGAARSGRACPTLAQFSTLLRLSPNTIHTMLNSLRNARVITWKLVYAHGSLNRIRVVTITATGAQTAVPGASAKRPAPPAKAVGPAFTGPGVRVLQGAEFEFWKNHYEARDRAERARAQA